MSDLAAFIFGAGVLYLLSTIAHQLKLLRGTIEGELERRFRD